MNIYIHIYTFAQNDNSHIEGHAPIYDDWPIHMDVAPCKEILAWNYQALAQNFRVGAVWSTGRGPWAQAHGPKHFPTKTKPFPRIKIPQCQNIQKRTRYMFQEI
jgi:hypothetical protein